MVLQSRELIKNVTQNSKLGLQILYMEPHWQSSALCTSNNEVSSMTVTRVLVSCAGAHADAVHLLADMDFDG